MKVKKVCIIGLGLIGGSLAKAIKERTPVSEVVAVNRSPQPLEKACHEGVISRGFTNIDPYLYDCDIVFVCTPVKYAVQYIEALGKHVKPDCIFTDVGSTKGEILDAINQMPTPPCFVGGHPMAGTEKTGYTAGFSHLFENAYYILTPSKSTTPEALDCMNSLIKMIGGIPVVLDAYEHDRITAGISHVPHVIASALVNMVKDMDTTSKTMQTLAAGGFKDITRIASSSPEIWESIVSSNKTQVKAVIQHFISSLEQFVKHMDDGNSQRIYDFFEAARDYRDTFTERRRGPIMPQYEIVVDVIDKPGIIGQIATILATNDVNIKNIQVSNSREFEQGCLRITLPDIQSVDRSCELLNFHGYKVFNTNI